MERISRETYDGKLKPGELDEAHILNTYQELNKATGTGYGKNWLQVEGATGAPAPEALQMQQNIFKFSGAKDAAMLEEINRLLTKDGKLANWPDFKEAVLKLNNKYNINYLQAEWQTARHSGYMANLWQEYLDNANLFPNLKYKTQEDERVRLEHELLNNTIAPITSPFWDEFYPPNGWRCRCYVVQTAEKPDNNLPGVPPEDVKPEFRINTGKSGQVFKEDGKAHPYFMLAKTSGTFKLAFELLKRSAPLNTMRKFKNGGIVRVSPFTDIRRDELFGNYRTAVALAEKEALKVDLVAKLDGAIIKNVPNPEYLINGKIADRKTPESLDYSKSLSRANKQGCEIVVVDLSKNNDSVVNAINAIDALLKKSKGTVHPNIKEVYVVSNDRKTVKHLKREKAD
jgi:hypothetical protein